MPADEVRVGPEAMLRERARRRAGVATLAAGTRLELPARGHDWSKSGLDAASAAPGEGYVETAETRGSSSA